MEPPYHVTDMMDQLVNRFGFPPEIANTLQYFYYFTGSYWNYAKIPISDDEAKAFVQKAHAHNEKLYAEKSAQTIYNDDMKAMKAIEENYNFRIRVLKICAKESGAFLVRLDNYFMNQFEEIYEICERLHPEKKATVVTLRTMSECMKMNHDRVNFLFAKNYSHWFWSDSDD